MTAHDMEDERPIDLEAGRRAFLQAAGLGGVMAAIAAASVDQAKAQSADLDVAILNFALNLEYLEGEYYQRGVYGVGLPGNITTGLGNHGGVSGGSQVPFQSNVVRDVSAEVANDEKNHIIYLRSVLGSKAVSEPTISLDAAFKAAAAAAGLPSSFNPFADDFSFLLGAYTLTEVGVTPIREQHRSSRAKPSCLRLPEFSPRKPIISARSARCCLHSKATSSRRLPLRFRRCGQSCRTPMMIKVSAPTRVRSMAGSRHRRTSPTPTRTASISPARRGKC